MRQFPHSSIINQEYEKFYPNPKLQRVWDSLPVQMKSLWGICEHSILLQRFWFERCDECFLEKCLFALIIYKNINTYYREFAMYRCFCRANYLTYSLTTQNNLKFEYFQSEFLCLCVYKYICFLKISWNMMYDCSHFVSLICLCFPMSFSFFVFGLVVWHAGS